MTWKEAMPFESIVPLESQGQYAALFVTVALALSACFLLAEKRSVIGTANSLLLGVLASLAFG
jgi:hypothetical protein